MDEPPRMEQKVLGTMLHNFERRYSKQIRKLKSAKFLCPSHQLIFEAIAELDAEGEETHYINVIQKLKEKGEGDIFPYVAELLNYHVSEEELEQRIKILKNKDLELEKDFCERN